ncbi:MAG: A24 family peptidase [Ramlibacter sp.]
MNDVSSDWLLRLPALADLRTATLVVLLIAAAAIDYRSYRIPNWLTLTGTLIGLALSAATAARPLSGFLWALAGAATGLAMLLPLYAMRVLGAGDVKLMAMVGAFLGLPEIVPALLCVFLAGGIAALAFAVVYRSVPRLAANLRDMVQGSVLSALTGHSFGGMAPGMSVGKLPYGVSICAGTLLYLVAHQMGYL